MKFGRSAFARTLKTWWQGPARSRSKPRTFRPEVAIEGLETREVMSTVAATPLAELSGFISAKKTSSLVFFQVNPGQFVSNANMPTILSFQAAAAQGSSVVPEITRVYHLNGTRAYDIPTHHGILFAKVVNPLSRPSYYAVRVKSLLPATGGFTVNVGLTGDLANNGNVNRGDLGLVRASLGSVQGQRRYNPAADLSRSGRVGELDLLLVRRNLGSAKSLISLNQIPRPNVYK